MLTVGALKYFEETGSCFSPVGTVFSILPMRLLGIHANTVGATWESKEDSCMLLQEQHHTAKMGNFIIKHYFLFSSFLVGSIHSWGKVSFRNLVLFYNVMPLPLLIRISLKENINNQERPKALPTLEKANRRKQWKLQTSPFYFLYTENCCRERAQ